MMPEKQAQVRVQLKLNETLPPPQGANFFHLSIARGEVELLVGYADLARIVQGARDRASDDDTVEVAPEITHRFMLSMAGLIDLRDRIVDVVGASGFPGMETSSDE